VAIRDRHCQRRSASLDLLVRVGLVYKSLAPALLSALN
jgi:hypothetical protein